MPSNPEAYSVEILTATEAMKQYPSVWLTAEKLLPELTGDELALVVSLAADTCQTCHENNSSCQCWNDD